MCLTSSALAVSWFHLDWPIHLKNKQEGTSTQMADTNKCLSNCLRKEHLLRTDSTYSKQPHGIFLVVLDQFYLSLYKDNAHKSTLNVNRPAD